MIRYNDVRMGDIAIHRVGNKHRAEKNFISESVTVLEVLPRAVLFSAFLSPMKKENRRFMFELDERTGENVVMNSVKRIFSKDSSLLDESKLLLDHLYSQSTHPNIKSGEVYIVHFTDFICDDELVEAIGIFKSERRIDYFKAQKDEKSGLLDVDVLDVVLGDGIKNIDKGCLILDSCPGDNYRLLSFDKNQYDTEYWLRSFLLVKPVQDEAYLTNVIMESLHVFSSEVIYANEDRLNQMKFLSDTADYFEGNERFTLDNFIEEIAEERNDRLRFFLDALDTPIDDFEICHPMVIKMIKKFKTQIKLDSGVKMDIDPAFDSINFLEKGFDADKGMKFLKVFYNEEI